MILKRCLKVATLQGGVDLKGGFDFPAPNLSKHLSGDPPKKKKNGKEDGNQNRDKEEGTWGEG
jgi:hypothetical protein